MRITLATTRMNLSRLLGPWVAWCAAAVAVVGLLAGCGSWGGPEKKVRAYPLDLGARSAPGMVCGVLDRRQIADLTGVPASLQHEDSLFRVYPSAGGEFRALECTVRDESYPQRELLGVVVRQDVDEAYVSRRRQVVDPAAGSLQVPRVWGKGAVAPGIGGYSVRSCPNGRKYMVHTGTLEKFGTAQQWLDIMGSVIKRADAVGACASRPSSIKPSTR
jgi:hypothetical protein